MTAREAAHEQAHDQAHDQAPPNHRATDSTGQSLRQSFKGGHSKEASMATTHGDTLRQPSFNAPIIEMITHTSASCARALLTYQEELLRFTTCRLESDAALGRALAQSRDWLEANQLQQQWLTTAVAEYAKEAERLLKMTTELTLDAASKTVSGAHDIAQAGAEAARKTADEAQSAAQQSTAQATEDYLRGAAEATSEAAERASDDAQATGERAARRTRRSSD
jgi:hypothetical protein